MSQVVASVTSAAGPIDGNENNSSPDFQFVELPASGNITVTISDNANANSISFYLWQDINNWPDKKATDELLTNNATFPVSDVAVGDNYYIGNPSNAGGQTFVVTFTAG